MSTQRYRPQEELVAEFSAVLISNRLQITCDTQNHASYLGGWASRIKDSKNPAKGSYSRSLHTLPRLLIQYLGKLNKGFGGLKPFEIFLFLKKTEISNPEKKIGD
ncbi:MAG: hypothetical protein CM15mV94_220 [uncultured marine virus]|nr:MAG: hypothetical protein CM15mV94_220 [uncultured marine virus]